MPYPLYDLTSSGLIEVWHAPVSNALRLDGQSFRQANFGMIEIDWNERTIDLSLRDLRGEPLLRKRLRLDELAMRQP